MTGSVPTEKLPQRSHEVPTKIRRTLVRSTAIQPTLDEEMPSTSSDLMSGTPMECPSIEDLLSQLENEVVLPWTVETTRENESIKFLLYDGVHSIAKYTVVLNAAMEFSVFAFDWPIPDKHIIYNERKRRVVGLESCKALLKLVQDSRICDGLPQDVNTMSAVVDPTSDLDLSNFPQTTVVRHSVPKSISESHFQTSVIF